MALAEPRTKTTTFRTNVPARLDRLPWSRWHWLVVIALGITWIIDGLEVTLIGAVSTVLQEPETLHFSGSEIGLLGTAYLAGAVLGALVFGYLTDRLGRKKLFTVTLGLYLVSAFLTALAWNFTSFAIFRFLTGAAIGGEYSAINSAIDELIPARVRGWADLAINGTFWLGAAAGSLASVVLLDRQLLPVNLGWRIGFGLGAALGLVIIFLRKHVPESPRWLLTHGHPDEAERVVAEIENQIEKDPSVGELPGADDWITIRPRGAIAFTELAGVMIRKYPGRTVLGLALIISQAFLYNGVFFTFPLVLRTFYGVHPDRTGFYLLPFALSNFLGPLVLGRLFDTIGRKPMIAATYTVSALLLAVTGYVFSADLLSPVAQTVLWARHLLLRLLGRELGLSDRERDLPRRAQRHGHRPLLRRRHPRRRHARPLALRLPGRHGLAHRPLLRLPVRRRAAAHHRGSRARFRRQGRADLAGSHRRAAVGRPGCRWQ